MSTQIEDVSAVVLTLGEPTTGAAIDSLSRQTLAPCEVIVVRDVRPFHAALNAGVTKVKTPFLVQVDADMILDPCCVLALRTAVRRSTGIVAGYLRDALIREAVGVKLYRTSCFQFAKLRDCISPDTEFAREISAAGWRMEWVGRPKIRRWTTPATLGEHCPTYTPRYTYAKHLLMGRRYRFRGDIGGIRWHFCRLEASRHPSAVIAAIGLARGIFLESERDLTGILPINEEFAELLEFLQSPGRLGPDEVVTLPLSKPAQDLFAFAYRTGNSLFRAKDFPTFARLFRALSTAADDGVWIAKVGLCRGLFAEHPDAAMIEADYGILITFLAGLTVRAKISLKVQQLLADRRFKRLPA